MQLLKEKSLNLLEQHITLSNIHYIGCFFSPNYKNFSFIEENKKMEIYQEISDLLKNDCSVKDNLININVNNCSNNSSIVSLIKSKKKGNIIFQAMNTLKSHNMVSAKSLDIELQNYLSIAINDDIDELTFWRNNEKVYPKLANLAKKYLSIQATEVPSERIFSSGEYLSKMKYGKLSKVSMMRSSFINYNCELLEK